MRNSLSRFILKLTSRQLKSLPVSEGLHFINDMVGYTVTVALDYELVVGVSSGADSLEVPLVGGVTDVETFGSRYCAPTPVISLKM